LSWMEGIVKGLIYLHSRNVMHCDLNTNNVLIAKDNVAKITDFGLSRVKVQSRLSNNLAATGMGTVRVLSHASLAWSTPCACCAVHGGGTRDESWVVDGTLAYVRLWLRVSGNSDPRASVSDGLQGSNDGDRDLTHAREWGRVLRLHR